MAYPRLVQHMLNRGWTEERIRNVLALNFLLRDSLGSFTGAWLGLTAVAALLLGLGLRFDPRRYAALFAERQARGVGAESLR